MPLGLYLALVKQLTMSRLVNLVKYFQTKEVLPGLFTLIVLKILLERSQWTDTDTHDGKIYAALCHSKGFQIL